MRNVTYMATGAALVIALLSGCGSSSGTSGESAKTPSKANGASGATVTTASIPSAGGTVLVDSEGRTLYSLSAERNGHFICTGSCESVWHPLAASAGALSGAQALGAVKRPDGTEQVTYKGMPLYTFASDTKPGEAKGQGIKDVGTWSAVTASSTSSSGGSTTTSSAPSESGGHAY